MAGKRLMYLPGLKDAIYAARESRRRGLGWGDLGRWARSPGWTIAVHFVAFEAELGVNISGYLAIFDH